MVNLSIGELADFVGGQLKFDSMPPLGGDLEPLRQVCVDSQSIEPGDVYWDLADGPASESWRVEEAFARGAQGVVVGRRRVAPWAGRFSLEVEDAGWALWKLARWARRQFGGNLVAVVGDGSGRTAEMAAAVLRAAVHSVGEPIGGRSSIAVALSMLKLDENADIEVCDFGGVRDFNELRKLARLCRPDIVIATGMDLPQPGAAASIEMPHEGTVVLNGDDPASFQVGCGRRGRRMLVGRGIHCDIAAGDVQFGDGRLTFEVDGVPFAASAWGRHQLPQVLACCAAGRLAGIAPREIAARLANFECEAAPGENGADCHIAIDETAASFASALRSLDAFGELATPGRRVVVCGPLPGAESDPVELHRQFGEAVVCRCGAEMLLACGEYANETANAARRAGMPASSVLSFADGAEAAEQLKSCLDSDDAVLAAGAVEEELRQFIATSKRAAVPVAA